jgi:ribonuclease HI
MDTQERGAQTPSWSAGEADKSRLKAFSALASQGAAIIRARKAPDGALAASFGPLSGFWRTWSDGSVPLREEELGAGLGGVVTDESGASVAAFSVVERLGAQAGRGGPMLAEMRALTRAMELAWEAGARKIEARFDCMPLVRACAAALLGDQEELERPESAKLLAAMDRFDCVALRWSPREANRLADALSKRPLGAGLFHGGSSQASALERAWADPHGAPAGTSATVQTQRRRERAQASMEGLSADGSSKIALGACWRDLPSGGAWIAAAGCADPLTRKSASIEQCGGWTLGRCEEPGPLGLRAALCQALAAKAARVAAKAGGRVEQFSVVLPRSAWEPLAQSGALDGFLAVADAALGSLAPGARVKASQAGAEGSEVSERQAAHLASVWELGRALGMQEINAARHGRRQARAARGPKPR